jgi:hypothetical protein
MAGCEAERVIETAGKRRNMKWATPTSKEVAQLRCEQGPALVAGPFGYILESTRLNF